MMGESLTDLLAFASGSPDWAFYKPDNLTG